MSQTTQSGMFGALSEAATSIDVQSDGDQTVVNFDTDLNTDYDLGHEVQSQIVIENGIVTEGVVRFGSAPLHPDEFIDTRIWSSLFSAVVQDIFGDTGVRARLSDFGRPVPHLCFVGMDEDDAIEGVVNLTEELSELYSLSAQELGQVVDDRI